MIRIMHICTDSNVGGAVVTLLRLIEGSSTDNIENIVLLPDTSPLFENFVCSGAIVVPLYFHDRSFSLRGIFQYIKYISKYRPHIVHTHGSVSGRIAGFICGIKSRIYTRHTFNSREYSFLSCYFNRLITTRAVAVCEALVDQIIASGIKDESISVIKNGAPRLHIVNNHQNREYNLLYLGRIIKDKGLDLALDGIRILHSIDNRFTLTIVGDGDYYKELESKISDLDMTGFVYLNPSTNNISDYISKCGIAINCSYENEAASNFILEAMSGRMVALVSGVGGNPELVDDLKTGRVFLTRDVNSFVECALDIISEYEFYQLNSFDRYISEYSLELMINNYIKLWEDEYEKFYV